MSVYLFQFYDYVALKRKIFDNEEITLDCTCDTFSTLVSTADIEFGEVNWDGVLRRFTKLPPQFNRMAIA